ncbi:MAG: AbrB/MazE/SpoVT family DNA-binding domain-containing protein [Gammaproteobacteria bacterium]|nr:AbrB/MazE/SpoVT family DNA-binding domain-containing protein [Gammaproteobacteria bacterium]
MNLVTVKPKYQVTIPAKLRKGINLKEGDVMEAIQVQDRILLELKEVVDRQAIADKIDALLKKLPVSPEDEDRTEDEIMECVVADIKAVRREQRASKE